MYEQITCPKCGESIRIPKDAESAFCMICGEKIQLKEDETKNEPTMNKEDKPTRKPKLEKYANLLSVANIVSMGGTVLYTLAAINGFALLFAVPHAISAYGQSKLTAYFLCGFIIFSVFSAAVMGMMLKALSEALKALRDIARSSMVSAGAEWDND